MYDPTDLVGDFDDDGNPIGDGTPDNPGGGSLLSEKLLRN